MEISAGLGRQTPTGSSPLLPLMIPNWLVSRATSTLFLPTTWLRMASTTSVSGGNRDLADSISITIDRGGSAALVWTDQGSVLNGPTHITYGCIIAGQSALAGAKRDLSCKGPAGP